MSQPVDPYRVVMAWRIAKLCCLTTPEMETMPVSFADRILSAPAGAMIGLRHYYNPAAPCMLLFYDSPGGGRYRGGFVANDDAEADFDKALAAGSAQHSDKWLRHQGRVHSKPGPHW